MSLRMLAMSTVLIFGGCSVLLTQIPDIPAEPVLQFGALGLVALMVLQNYRQSKHLTQANMQLSEKLTQANMQLSEELTRANKELTAALTRIAEALRDRP